MELSGLPVRLGPVAPGVFEIAMCDVEGRNAFSPMMVRGLRAAFARAAADPDCRVVVLVGEGAYFAIGGTDAQLGGLREGRLDNARILDTMRIVGDCPLPVIAALQGHAFGGGLALALYADLMVFARERSYAANFIELGFSPGAGASVLLPARLGPGLATEMLLGGQGYRGEALARRGIDQPVVPASEVRDHARSLATAWARAPRATLIEVKRLLAARWREAWDAGIGAETTAFEETSRTDEVTRRLAARREPAEPAPPTRLEVLARLSAGELGLDEAERLLSGGAPSSPAALPELPPPERRPPTTAATASGDVAIIGIGCRFPGADDAPTLWRNLEAGVDSVTAAPTDRWARAPGPDVGDAVTDRGGFLRDIDAFDAALFGISPAEAEIMDPQQRLFLEQCHRAIDDAGYGGEALRGARCGVFVGAAPSDYDRVLQGAGLDTSRFTMTGLMSSLLASRIAYLLDLRGPAIAIDTACSASLVAVHLACESLRSGESTLALAGGVTLLTTPLYQVRASRFSMLSPQGRCRPFDADASGIVLAEGCGAVLLKPVDAARRDGDHIYAVIKASGVNQDGSTNGITAPSARAQAELMRAVYRRFDVDPRTIGYVEAHGTGTPLGDPIEYSALSEVLAEAGVGPGGCGLGSIKGNLGHAQLAAGVAGLIKAALCLHHRVRVPSLHFRRGNPAIDFARGPLRVDTARQGWGAPGETLRAAVSAFGFSGTNAHVVLESAPPAAPASRLDRPFALPLSAASAAGLTTLAAAWRARLDGAGAAWPDLAFTAAVGRGHHRHRCAVVAESADSARAALERVEAPEQPPRPPRIALVYPGQGAQYRGMGRALYESEPVFRAVIDRCDRASRALLDPPLLDAMWGGEADGLLTRTRYTQPALYALGCGLTALWRAWGVEPELVMGHSVGELAAAWCAGVFSLEDGLRLVAARGRLMDACRPGEMVAVGAAEAQVRAAVDDTGAPVDIAAVNGPRDVVIAGQSEALAPVLDALREAGVRLHRLEVSHAFHSADMDAMLDAFAAEVARVDLSPPDRGVVSSLTGHIERDRLTEPGYWVRHAREAVRFNDGVAALGAAGVDVVVEAGPSSTLGGMIRRAMAPDARLETLPSLRRGRPPWETLTESVARLYALGAPIDWRAHHRADPRRRVPAPGTAFERGRFWPAPTSPGEQRPAARSLLGRRAPAMAHAPDCTVWQGAVDAASLGGLASHRIDGRVVLPLSAYLDVMLSALSEADGAADRAEPGPTGFDDLELHRPLVVADGGRRVLQTTVFADDRGPRRIEIHSRAEGHDRWTLHATAVAHADEDAR